MDSGLFTYISCFRCLSRFGWAVDRSRRQEIFVSDSVEDCCELTFLVLASDDHLRLGERNTLKGYSVSHASDHVLPHRVTCRRDQL